MSLAKRNDGCMECRRRRVRCDKTQPQCLKCRKKGIRCSGQGLECRFSPHMMIASRPSLPTQSRRYRYQWVRVTGERPASTSVTMKYEEEEEDKEEEKEEEGPSPRPAIETHTSQARMLFHHFSTFIAAKMVVFDHGGNGYRNILLPLACQDQLLSRAICVVAGFHLSQMAPVPHMRMAAELGQQAILSRLLRDSLRLKPRQLFSLSTWATILVLLVGETITGANNFVYLLDILSTLTDLSESTPSLVPSTRAFIQEQTRMFKLFGFPLSSEEKGLEMLSKQPDHYLGFMTSPLSSLSIESERFAKTFIMKEAIRQACHIYQNRAKGCVSDQSSVESVEALRRTVLGLDPHGDGCHALVWTYFTAAAESILPEHRDFFSHRLRCLYSNTRFGTIPMAVQSLDRIWAAQASQRWTRFVTEQWPILIM